MNAVRSQIREEGSRAPNGGVRTLEVTPGHYSPHGAMPSRFVLAGIALIGFGVSAAVHSMRQVSGDFRREVATGQVNSHRNAAVMSFILPSTMPPKKVNPSWREKHKGVA